MGDGVIFVGEFYEQSFVSRKGRGLDKSSKVNIQV